MIPRVNGQYPNTTGLSEIGYRLTDAIVDPPEVVPPYTEELIRLEGCFCVYNPTEPTPDVVELPAHRKNHITFASLHNLAKLNQPTIDLWCSVLRAIPTSRMLVFRNTLQGERREQVRRQFESRGIAPDRVECWHEPRSPSDYLGVYDQVDIQLDALPWSGHVTTCESLWMGVPMITLAGTRGAGRMSSTILNAVGRSEWIARTADEFVAIARRVAEDRTGLSKIRSCLRGQMRSSMLCDGKSFCRRLEAEFRRIWGKWCKAIGGNCEGDWRENQHRS
jgi:predicted O-linked N-acetylglucosamine transferase (SPINDLY family)